MSEDGVDDEVLCHLISCSVLTSVNPDGVLLTYESLLKDLRNTIVERDRVLYYGRDRK